MNLGLIYVLRLLLVQAQSCTHRDVKRIYRQGSLGAQRLERQPKRPRRASRSPEWIIKSAVQVDIMEDSYVSSVARYCSSHD